ncbi:DEKNAAC103758, partial [Brettanomyces naardenensis]
MSFLDEEPPPGYIAGLGRGATGFSTQADLGSSSRIGYGNREGSEGDERFGDERFEDAAEENEEMIGYVGGAVEEDDEADKVFEEVERRLKRRKTRKKEGKDEGVDKNKDGDSVDVTEVTAGQSIKAIGEKFQESKQALASVSNEEWANLPESGDFTRKTKRRREQMQMQQRFYRNSDSVTVGLRDSGSTDMSAIGGSSENVDIAQISLARDRVLAGQLSKMKEDGTDGSVDKSAYLSSLSGSFVNNIGDYSRTRSMFAKMRRSEPYKVQNWIASARLEMEAKKPKRAKELISEGCLKCPKSVEVWLVSLEIHSGDVQTCKVIIADAVKHNPRSVELWLEATKLENDRLSQKRVLMKALEFIPKSAKLWLELSGGEDDTEMQIQMLKKSTELIPESVGLWLKLASLEDAADARDTFNRARKAVNSEDVHTIWISAAKLEEKSTENEVKVTRLVEKCFQVAGNSLDRYEWLHEAVIAEKDGYPLTSRAIVFNCINIGMEEEEDVAEVWKKDALGASNNGSLEVARSIYMFMT